MEELKFLNTFRKKNVLMSTKSEEVFFLLDKDENGYFVEVVDKKMQKHSFDYVNYNGNTFNVLKLIQSIRERNYFKVSWETDLEKIYLAENSYLMYHLVLCNNLIDNQKNTFVFNKNKAKIKLEIVEDSTNYWSKLLLYFNENTFENYELITENFVLFEKEIIEIQNIGNNFDKTPTFNTSFPKNQIELFLSVFFSHIENVNVNISNLKIIFDNEEILTQPIIIFEKIDLDNSLFMRISQMLPNLNHEYFEQFEITQIAVLNEFENNVHIHPINQNSINFHIEEISKVLRKYTKTKEDKQSLVIDDNLFILADELASKFIFNELHELLLKYSIFGTEKLKTYKISTHQPKLNFSIQHGIDFLEGDATLSFGDYQISLFDAINQYNKQNYILLSDGSRNLINEGYIKKLERIFKKKKEKATISFFDLPLIDELIDEKLQNATFTKHRNVFEGFNKLKNSKLKLPKVNAKLRDYQKQGVVWLDYLHENKLGGCLADDMGLGKTLQAITMLTKVYPALEKPSLIVVPKSLLYNWENEFNKFSPEIKFFIYYGNDRDLEKALTHNIIITTYAMVRNDIEKLKDLEFYYLILDESQNIKNINAQTTQAVMILNGIHKLALSGTPIENNLGELYSLFRFLNPGMFYSSTDFNQNYAIPIQKNNDKDAILQLRKKIYPFILRRLKSEVLQELPDLTEQELFVEMSPEQKTFYELKRMQYYESLKKEIAINGVQKTQILFFQALTELRQIASVPEVKTNNKIQSPKIELLIEYLNEAIANNHKVIVFTNFIAGVELIGEQLDNENIDYVSMTGSTHDRQKLVDRFQNEINCKVFLMTLKTGGVGLNLTAADTVFIFDPWWNRAAEIQAISRAHRIGQIRKVISFRLITKGTIEEKILLLQQKKAELFDNIISSDTASIKSLTEKDIDFILG